MTEGIASRMFHATLYIATGAIGLIALRENVGLVLLYIGLVGYGLYIACSRGSYWFHSGVYILLTLMVIVLVLHGQKA